MKKLIKKYLLLKKLNKIFEWEKQEAYFSAAFMCNVYSTYHDKSHKLHTTNAEYAMTRLRKAEATKVAIRRIKEL